MNGSQGTIILASTALAALCVGRVYRVFRPRSSPLDHPALFFLLVCASLLVLRLPHIGYPTAFNPDESQMLAQSMRFLAHPVPWRDVDGTTSGPLNSLVLSLPVFCGAAASWYTARMVLWGLICLTLVFLYLALRCFGTRSDAQFVLLPTVYYYAFSVHRDFIHYYSEALPVLLLSVCLYLLARLWTGRTLSCWNLFCLGIVAGSVPFTKLQASPLAILMVVGGGALINLRCRTAKRLNGPGWRAIATLVIGGAMVPCLILGVVSVKGALGDFWTSYILATSAYTREIGLPERIESVLGLINYCPSEFKAYLVASIGATAISFILCWIRGNIFGHKLFWPVVFAEVNVAVTLCCLLVAGKPWFHYLQLLIPAVSMLWGAMYFASRQAPASLDKTDATGWWLQRLLRFALLLVIGLQLIRPLWYVGKVGEFTQRTELSTFSSVGIHVVKASRPGDTLSVWGWMPGYYVETGLAPATRDAITQFMISTGPYQDYYRERYLKDLEKSKPAIFIDAIADGAFVWDWTRADNKHESFPKLAQHVANNYSLWLTIYLSPEPPVQVNGLTSHLEQRHPVRVYLSKQRMLELHLTPTVSFAP